MEFSSFKAYAFFLNTCPTVGLDLGTLLEQVFQPQVG